MGAVTPIGNNVNSFWNNLLKGSNGISEITQFDTENFKTKLAAEVKIDLNSFFSTKELNILDRFSSLALIAADEAIQMSNLMSKDFNKNSVGVIIGSGIGGIKTLEEQHKRLLKNPKRVSPYFIPSMISDIASGHISIKYGFKGPNYSIVSACATGNHCIGNAYNMIKNNETEIVLAGGTEASISPLAISGFSNMKALSKQTDKNIACRPFDSLRDGFVMGEGCGMLMLESLESAEKRNAEILGEIIGYAATADAHHLTSPDPDGLGAISSMTKALNNAKIKPEKIDYINAHGTSTKYNDLIETQAIKKVFDKHAYNLSISSSKSMTGHLLGAAGAIESIASILTLKNSIISPTINYKNKDLDCDLDYTPNTSKNKNCSYALSNTFGFGGHNATLIFKKFLN